MADKEEQESNSLQPSPLLPPLFLQITCKSLDKTSRFAAGTKAGFAVSLINRKLGIEDPLVSHIEAIKDGEEPISFGPDANLVDYGNGWKLQTVTELDFAGVRKVERIRLIPTQVPNVNSDGSHSAAAVPETGFGFLYIAKILVAFILMFVMGAVFTLALDNLPGMILLINSYM
eukprot:XP_015578827.1 uncharacterized protein LOC8286495 [Ricinus communis]